MKRKLFRCLLKVRCELRAQASRESVPQFRPCDSEGELPNVLFGAGNQELHRRAGTAEQPTLILHRQAV